MRAATRKNTLSGGIVKTADFEKHQSSSETLLILINGG